jgi:hypothetical protein
VSDVKYVELAISTAVKYHPNHPRIDIEKRGMSLNLEEMKREHSEEKNVDDHASKDDINHTSNKRRKLQIGEHNSSSAQ